MKPRVEYLLNIFWSRFAPLSNHPSVFPNINHSNRFGWGTVIEREAKRTLFIEIKVLEDQITALQQVHSGS
jgi:hypothetical protein